MGVKKLHVRLDLREAGSCSSTGGVSMCRVAVGFVSLLVVSGFAPAQNYPTRPIRIVTSTPRGSGDFISRLMSQEVSSRLGQQIVVENRPTNLTGGIVARAQPDGYTLLVAG